MLIADYLQKNHDGNWNSGQLGTEFNLMGRNWNTRIGSTNVRLMQTNQLYQMGASAIAGIKARV